MVFDATSALHTAARRYCLDRIRILYEEARHEPETELLLDRDGHPLAIRVAILAAIREEVETFIPANFDSLAEARLLLRAAGFTADSLLTKAYRDPVDRIVMQEERENYVRFVTDLEADELTEIVPLPYSRVLTSRESDLIWRQLEESWQITARRSYWIPLAEEGHPRVTAFRTTAFQQRGLFQILHWLLLEKSVARLYEMPEIAAEREIAVPRSIPPFEPVPETFWTGAKFDWIVYVSHENSVAVGGWLLEGLQEAYPGWESLLWSS